MKTSLSKLSAVAVIVVTALSARQLAQAEIATGFFTGKIETIDVRARTLTVKGAESSMTFAVATDAKIYSPDKKELALSDLKVGQEVTVDYTRDSGIAVAHTITLKNTTPPLPGEKPAPL